MEKENDDSRQTKQNENGTLGIGQFDSTEDLASTKEIKMKCSYCEKAILAGQDSVDYAGYKLHVSCHDEMGERGLDCDEDYEIDPTGGFELDESDFDDYDECINIDCGQWDDGRYDDDFSPYSGDYSEM